jgi:hypothetical protein
MKTIAALLLGAWASTAVAHHSNTAFDMTQSVVWKVQVTEFRFVNPHAYVYFTMADDDGKTVEGRCELGSRTALKRMGWSIDTIKPDEKLTIKGAPGRNEPNVCFVNSFVRSDGTEVGAHEQLP